jgi:UDP-glucuronate decarboxylase
MHLKKRIIVTGGTGFLDSHLVKKLLECGDEVLCVDNFFTSNRDNITEFHANPNFELMRHDVTLPLVVEVDTILQPRLPGISHSLPGRPGTND